MQGRKITVITVPPATHNFSIFTEKLTVNRENTHFSEKLVHIYITCFYYNIVKNLKITCKIL